MNTAPVPNAAPVLNAPALNAAPNAALLPLLLMFLLPPVERSSPYTVLSTLFSHFPPVRRFLLMFAPAAPALLLQLFLLMFLPSIALLFMLYSRCSSTTAAVCSTDTTTGVPGMVLPLLLMLMFPNVAVLQFCFRN